MTFVQLSLILCLSVFGWLIFSGSDLSSALIRGFIVFMALITGHKLVLSLLKLIVDSAYNDPNRPTDA